MAPSQAVWTQAQKLLNTEPWVWLVRFPLDVTTSATLVVRLCNTDEIVEFPTSSGNFFYPFPFRPPKLEQDSDGTQRDMELVLSNAGGELSGFVEAYDPVGKEVNLWKVHKSALASADAARSVTVKVKSLLVTEDAVAVRLGRTDLTDPYFPLRIVERDRCQWQFTGVGCAFVLPTSLEVGYGLESVMTCDKTVDGANGCQKKGNNEADRFLPVLHPQFFGAFPSVPLGRR